MAYSITDACVSCGQCADVCPADAICEKDGQYSIDAAKCVDCGQCVDTCPSSAITEA
jgi:formate hydrogenlyase subunit 6/NADH:ubiquinone oxidoreductase subunit I